VLRQKTTKNRLFGSIPLSKSDPSKYNGLHSICVSCWSARVVRWEDFIVIGTTLSHYRITDKLGAGGMGEVYLAEDLMLDRKVAVKILPREMASDRDRAQRFLREAKAASALSHPNVCVIHEVGETDDGLPIDPDAWSGSLQLRQPPAAPSFSISLWCAAGGWAQAPDRRRCSSESN
jgi:serine/threonine protein kinase